MEKKLTSQERGVLTKEAHGLKPVVMVGMKGVTPSLIKMVDESLESHELIKIKFIDFKETRREISEEICKKTRAALVRVVGNVAILYRAASKPEDRKYGI